MALAATAIVDVRNGGSDTTCGGLFNPGATLNSNLAATSATGSSPVVTSATYNFVAGDVGHWLFIKSGTNWTPGWYQIASVAANAATLTAGVGTAPLYENSYPSRLNTAAGCATTASPTSGSWTIDYSQVGTVPFSLTGLTTAAANAIILTASATVAMVGNGIQITGGTNFTTGFYQVNSVSAGASLTVDRNCTTAAGVAGTAGLGGGLASPGQAGSLATTAGNLTFIKYNATAFTATSASTNVAAGCVSGTAGTFYVGYNTNRTLSNTDASKPTFKIGIVSTATLFAGSGSCHVVNIAGDGNSQTSSVFISAGIARNCTATAFTNGAFKGVVAVGCSATANATVAPFSCPSYWCEAYANTISGFSGNITNFSNCLSYGNTGASSDGFSLSGTCALTNCVAYGNGRSGFRFSSTARMLLWNCIAEGNATYGYDGSDGSSVIWMVNCASYNNSGGRLNAAGLLTLDSGSITGSGSFFTNAASNDFSLNNTAGAGALCRATGYPATFPRGTTADYADVGAAQSQASGVSSGMLYHTGGV